MGDRLGAGLSDRALFFSEPIEDLVASMLDCVEGKGPLTMGELLLYEL